MDLEKHAYKRIASLLGRDPADAEGVYREVEHLCSRLPVTADGVRVVPLYDKVWPVGDVEPRTVGPLIGGVSAAIVGTPEIQAEADCYTSECYYHQDNAVIAAKEAD